MKTRLLPAAPLALLAALLWAGTAAAEGLKVAVVDVNKVLNESEIGKEAKKKIEARFAELKKTIDAKNGEAKKLKEEIDKQKILMGKDSAKVKEKEEGLKTKVEELRQLTQESEKEMQGRQTEVTREILKQIEAELAELVKEEKIDLVLEKSSGVVYYNDAFDITATLLARVDKGKAGGR